MRHWLLSFAALFALGVPALAGANADPGSDRLLPVPPLARVSDNSAVLSPGDRAALESKLAAFEAKQGSQIAILLVPSTKPEPIEDFAHRVGDTWKIGRKGIGDGVLVIVAIQDRTARIDVARSLEGAIPDVVASRIIAANMAPHFARKDYAGGLNEALDVLFARIGGEGLAPGPGGSDTGAVRNARDGSEVNADARIRALIPFIVGGLLVGALLRRLLGVLGAMLAAGGALAIVAYLFSSLLLGGVVAIVVFVLTVFGAPLMIATQVLGGRGGGLGGLGGGFRSGGGGDFSGGGASGNW